MLKIKKICQKFKIKPLKKRGQVFLINQKILMTIIKAAELKKNDIVLEIGPGFGILTEELIKKAKKVVAVEIDKKLVNFLKKKFKDYRNIEIVEGDILKFSSKSLNLRPFKYKIVANLPYNITGIFLRKFLTEEAKPNLMVLMIQKEVAERIVEKNNKSSIISLMVNFYSKPKIISYISKNNFWPRPKVDSAILRISPIKKDLSQIKTTLFFKLLRQGFSNPRKQLINNLKKIKEKEILLEIFRKLGFNLKIRAEDLNLKNWLKIYHCLYEK